jgi:hypothetical protein
MFSEFDVWQVREAIHYLWRKGQISIEEGTANLL